MKLVPLILAGLAAILAYILTRPNPDRIFSINEIDVAVGDQIVYRPQYGETVYIKPNGDEFPLHRQLPAVMHPIQFHRATSALIESRGFDVTTDGEHGGMIFATVV